MHSNRVTKTLSFFSKSLLSMLLLTVFFAPLEGLLVPIAQAQTPNARATSDANNPNISPTATGATTPGQGGTVTTSSTGQPSSSAGSGNNGEISDSCWKSSWAICFSNVVYVFTVGLMSIFAYIGAFVFDTAIQISLQSVTYSQYFLTQSWAAVRDLANMIFIFLLVYLAITVILQAETQGTMKMLAGIIIAALLINFSFFFTRLVIDGGNLLALQFYNAIDAPSLTESAQNSTGVVGTGVTNIASHLTSNGNVKDLTRGIMDVIGVQSLVGSGSFSQFAKQENVGFWTVLITLTFVYIAVAVILAMLAFTFIAVGVKFIVRVVVLWLTIIASPLAFVFGAMYDKSKSDRFNIRKRWLGSLIEYSFYPAVFLFIFWIINFFANGLSSGGSVLTAALQEASGASGRGAPFVIASVVAGISIRLGIIIALMYMAMRVSDSFAKTGYKAVDSLVTKYSGGTARKLTGWTQPYLKGWVQKPAAVTKTVAKAPFLAAREGIGYGYRNKIAKPIKKAGDTFVKGKFANTESAFNWKDRFANDVVQKHLVKPVADFKPLGATSYTDAKKYTDERTKEHKKNLDTLQNKEDIKKLPDLQNQIKPLAEREKTQKELEAINIKLTKIDDIEKAINERQSELTRKKDAGGTFNEHEEAEYDDLVKQRRSADTEKSVLVAEKTSLEAKNNPLNEEEKSSLREKRASIQKIEDRIKDFNKSQIEAVFTTKDVENIIGSIKESTLKKIEDSDKFSDQDKESLREKWHKESSEAALQKAQKQIELLKQIHKDLKQQSSYRITLQSIERSLGSGALLNSSAIENMLSEVKDKIVEERERRGSRGLQKDARITAGKNVNSLEKIEKALEKLNEERAKIPPKIAGGNSAGELKIT